MSERAQGRKWREEEEERPPCFVGGGGQLHLSVVGRRNLPPRSLPPFPTRLERKKEERGAISSSTDTTWRSSPASGNIALARSIARSTLGTVAKHWPPKLSTADEAILQIASGNKSNKHLFQLPSLVFIYAPHFSFRFFLSLYFVGRRKRRRETGGGTGDRKGPGQKVKKALLLLLPLLAFPCNLLTRAEEKEGNSSSVFFLSFPSLILLGQSLLLLLLFLSPVCVSTCGHRASLPLLLLLHFFSSMRSLERPWEGRTEIHQRNKSELFYFWLAFTKVLSWRLDFFQCGKFHTCSEGNIMFLVTAKKLAVLPFRLSVLPRG